MATPAQRLRRVLWLTIIACLAAISLALWQGTELPLVAGCLGLGYVAVRLMRANQAANDRAAMASVPWSEDPADMNALIESMLRQGRQALLLRPELACHMSADQLDRAQTALQAEMAMLEPGEVVVGALDTAAADGELAPSEIEQAHGVVVDVPALFLDKFPVTNAQYHRFVAAGGYQQMAIWEPQIWPAVADFVDSTGQAGPRFWANGTFLPGEDLLPVVGINWYEANAYARWVGKRLPRDAEWVKAAAWPVVVSAELRGQRKYPWGEGFDPGRANIGTGIGRLLAANHHPASANPAGVEQLIGNAWEWTADDFAASEQDGWEVVLPCVMKSIRGGAYDTYFENQATAHFASGDNPVARKHNIGFRCAVSALDFLPPDPEMEGEAANEVEINGENETVTQECLELSA